MPHEHILLASADARWVTPIAALLAADGYRVSVARTGVDALYQARMRRPHLLFLDPELPQLSGWEVCRRLKRRAEPAATKIVLITLEAGAAHRAGADGYLVTSGPLEPSLPPVHVFRAPQGILRAFLHRRARAA
jgi:hypothetical protein